MTKNQALEIMSAFHGRIKAPMRHSVLAVLCDKAPIRSTASKHKVDAGNLSRRSKEVMATWKKIQKIMTK